MKNKLSPTVEVIVEMLNTLDATEIKQVEREIGRIKFNKVKEGKVVEHNRYTSIIIFELARNGRDISKWSEDTGISKSSLADILKGDKFNVLTQEGLQVIVEDSQGRVNIDMFQNAGII